MPFELLHADPTLVVAQSGRLLFAVWWDAPNAAQMDVIRDAGEALRASTDGPTAYAQFVLAGTPRFSSEVRRKAQEMSREQAELAVTHVIEVGGLAGSAARAFLSALLLVAQPSTPVRVHATPEQAALFLAGRLRTVEAGWSPERVLALRMDAIAARPAPPERAAG